MKEKLTTFERRLEILFLITNCNKTTIMELSYYFEVSKNTVIRDIEFLSRYAPIYTKQGMFGGIFVFDEYRKNLLLPLSDDEEGLLKKLSENLDGKELHLINTIVSKYSKPKIST